MVVASLPRPPVVESTRGVTTPRSISQTCSPYSSSWPVRGDRREFVDQRAVVDACGWKTLTSKKAPFQKPFVMICHTGGFPTIHNEIRHHSISSDRSVSQCCHPIQPLSGIPQPSHHQHRTWCMPGYGNPQLQDWYKHMLKAAGHSYTCKERALRFPFTAAVPNYPAHRVPGWMTAWGERVLCIGILFFPNLTFTSCAPIRGVAYANIESGISRKLVVCICA